MLFVNPVAVKSTVFDDVEVTCAGVVPVSVVHVENVGVRALMQNVGVVLAPGNGTVAFNFALVP